MNNQVEIEHHDVASEAKAAVAYAAILCPLEFDNCLFWHRVYEEVPQDREAIERAARTAGLSLSLEHVNGDATFFPPPDGLLIEIVRTCSHARQIIAIIKACAPSPKGLDWMDDYLINALPPTCESAIGGEPPNNSYIFRGRDDGPNPPNPPNDPPNGPNPPNPPNDPPNGPNLPLGPTEGSVSSDSVNMSPEAYSQSYTLLLKILGGVMMVLGAIALVVAFAALNAATFGTAGLVVAGVGAAAALSGFSLFSYGCYQDMAVTSSNNSTHAPA